MIIEFCKFGLYLTFMEKFRKIILLLILSFTILNCSYKNEFGQRRNKFDIKKIKPNSDENVYNIIDTTKLYLEVSLRDTFNYSLNTDYNNVLKSNPRYLKFYRNGRVGQFEKIDLKDIESFNPKKAESYLYKLKNNLFTVQTYFKHTECGECFIKKELNKISDSIIELKSENYIQTYMTIKIPKSYLIFRPDW